MVKSENSKKKILLICLIIFVTILLSAILILENNSSKKTSKKHPLENKTNNEISNEQNNTIQDKRDEEIEDTKDNKKDKEESKNDNSTITKPSKNNNSNKNNMKPSSNNNNNKPNSNSSSNKPNSNSNNNKPSSNTNSNKPTTDSKPEEKPIPEPVDKNDKKRKTIEKAYSIKIFYGDEIGNYKPKGITPTKLTNESEIEDHLNRLNTELAKYPKGFFNDFNKKGMPLTIYLIKNANGSFSGFTDYQFMNDIKLTLATNYDFEYTLHHEIMHYIDCYLNIVMYPKTPYDEYETFNPTGFKYGSATSTQIYNMASNQRGAYFVSQYGATNVAEDRAEVFKFMMARAYAPIGCFEKDEIIRKKAEIISKQIKTYFPSVTGSTHWDRFIK